MFATLLDCKTGTKIWLPINYIYTPKENHEVTSTFQLSHGRPPLEENQNTAGLYGKPQQTPLKLCLWLLDFRSAAHISRMNSSKSPSAEHARILQARGLKKK